jgi:hypothetical protein
MSGSHKDDPAVKRENKAGVASPVPKDTPACVNELPAIPEQAVLAWLRETVAALSTAATLTEMLKVLVPRLGALGVMLLEATLECRDRKWRDVHAHVACPKCGRGMKKRKNRVGAGRKTLVGEVRHSRTFWECPHCHHSYAPVDAELGVGGGANRHESGFVSLLLYMCTALQFEKGCELFQRSTGVPVSTQLAQGLVEHVGGEMLAAEMARAEEVWQLQFEKPELFLPGGERFFGRSRPGTVYLMQDNSKVGIHEGRRGRGAPEGKRTHYLDRLGKHEKGKQIQEDKRGAGHWHDDGTDDRQDEDAGPNGYRDVRALIIFRAVDLKEGKGGRKYIERKVIRSHIGTAEEWKKLVHLALYEAGVFWAQRVVIIADGGQGIWELMEDLLPKTPGRTVVQILDWCHAVSHLWKVATAYKGSKTPPQRSAARQWLGSLLDELHAGHPSVVLQRLRNCPTDKAVASDFADTLRKCIDYFDKHRERMLYGRYREAGLLIGSGPIESVHAWAIQPRLRLPGMRWSVAGANRMLRLRCAWASGTWDADLAKALEALRKKPPKRKEGAAM